MDVTRTDIAFFAAHQSATDEWAPDVKFGHNETVGATYETIWGEGGQYVGQTSPVALFAVSASAADAAAGTGAQSLTVVYIDANGKEQSVTKDLNGVTEVDLEVTGYAVNRAYVETAGSGLENAGVIRVGTTGMTTVLAHMHANDGQAEQGVFRVPINEEVYISDFHIFTNATSAKAADFRARFRLPGATFGTLGPKRTALTLPGCYGPVTICGRIWRKFPPGALLWLEGKREAAAGSDVDVSAQWEMIRKKI